IAPSIKVPLIVKEVGFGMSRQTIRQLVDAGVSIIDVGGAGGTNFAKVENKRREHPLEMFEDWGLTTVQSLLEAGECQLDQVSMIASGGIKNGLDIGKAIALGANAVGMAGRILQLVQNLSPEECCKAVEEWHHQLRILMTALGTTTLAELQDVP
ncbi:alpha-hydroxy-acid oxidizing protein, partial [Microbacteriaceae bacterium K1510]|nr:alpha-hydroxy-acid oxidizing protein [Microbacteriaceae bacterium K1510]